MKKIYLDEIADHVELLRRDFPGYVESQIELADHAVDNTFIFTDRYEMERCTTPVHFDGEIDWNLIPFGDEEWCYAFNRHTFLGHLSRAYAFTKDTRYRDAFIRLFTDFAENTRLEEGTRKGCWRSLETGIRIENYIRGFEIFELLGEPLDGKMYELLDKLFDTTKEYLLDTHTAFHRLSNWGVLQDHGLFLIAAERDDRELMEEAVRRMDEEFRFQTFRDGSHWEQSPMYQAEVLHCGLDTVLAANRIGYKLPRTLVHNIRNMARGLGKMLRPDGRSYLYGDSDHIDFRDQIALAAVLFNDGELSYRAEELDAEFYINFPVDTVLPKAEKPESLSAFLPESGNVYIRTGKDSAVHFHAGLYGSGHGHLDQLHFDLYHNGTVMLTDTGRGTYVDGEWRRALKGGRGHNTILIDGDDMSKMKDSWGIADFAEPMMSQPYLGDQFSFTEGMHFGFFKKGVVVKRRLITIEDKAVLVLDDVMVTGHHDHNVKILFHFDDSMKPELVDGEVRDGSFQMILPEEMDARLSTYPLSHAYNEKVDSPLLTLEATVGKTTSFATLIVYNQDSVAKLEKMDVYKPLTKAHVPEEYAFGMRITIDGTYYDVLNMMREYPDRGFLIQVGDLEQYAHVAIKKQDEETVILKR